MGDSPMAVLMADSWGPPTASPIYEEPALENVESLEGYAPGGYYPMNIDDRLRKNLDTYTIIHKLGFGRSSTVWLARRDSESIGQVPVSFVALKILRADLSTPNTYPELEILGRLQQQGRETHRGLVHIQDYFTVSSANGHHCCFVLPFLGPSLYNKRVLAAMSCETRESVCEQLAHAVKYIHTFGVCHADLSPLNVRFRIPDVEHFNETRICAKLTPIQSCAIRRIDGQPLSKNSPRCVVKTAEFQNIHSNYFEEVTIISFGRAFSPPVALRIPPLSEKRHLAARVPIFLAHERELPFLIHVGFEHLVWELTTYFGPIPDHWAGKYQWDKYKIVTRLGTTCDSDLDHWFDRAQPTESLESHLVKAEMAPELATLLYKMFVWEPEMRLTADTVYRELLQQRLNVESNWLAVGSVG
ncbi:kinase-like domain-containing protein [Chaetomium fimeti]|uniref:non-specific serine/threonine protein kinase n=1 Tax=Chaetomium fimeti TaxID=1854472 RepID=A0AAE0H7Y9_9PEZI|nr:kinase-like domain-containing protein [Chaetomium fimeti]